MNRIRVNFQRGSMTMAAVSRVMALAAVVATTVGCSGEGLDESTVHEGALVEFQDRFGTAGLLIVVRDEGGNLGMSFAEPIDDAPPSFRSELVGRSLAEIYEALHPGEHAPAKLERLSAEFSEAHRNKPSAAREVTGQRVDESLSSFNSTVCRNLPGDTWAWYWKKIRCGYEPVPGAPPAAWNYYTGDISAGWNETDGSAYHTNSNSTWKPVIPPRSYYWTQWNMTHEGAVIEMRPFDPAAHLSGAYGVTVHRKTSNIQAP